MMIDWGIPLGQQKDILASQGHLVDKAKIAAGIPRFMPVDLLKQKLSAYRDAGISTANGGLLTELTLKQGTYDAMLAEMVEVGFDAVEVSENLVPLSAAAKTEAVCVFRGDPATCTDSIRPPIPI
ncbi:(2R)-phospho-3-sulfolactate synthase (ComA) [Sulfitobacter brevis]|uniref:(2R)-phospho-3-sulfolactate synthase (ComA) n=2 Tax=Sulfitobacter brevis TaxID=74348 RepID=A0A1I2H3H3_9RHOB|nr:(2R)-phospho-3-sulfolactate synthase (ComA) [Sulfitobacter brevis]